jgi:DNA-binding CsgD family transcriptional regulator
MIADALATRPAPRVALRVGEPLRRRLAQRGLADTPEDEADVVVLALGPGEALPRAVRVGEPALLVLTDDPAFAADASLPGVLPASAPAAQVAAAAAAIAEGLTVRIPGATDRPAFAMPELARPLLTPREVEILALVGQGQSNKAIARGLGISAHTVKYHLESVFAKLGASSRAEAVTTGLRRGLLLV